MSHWEVSQSQLPGIVNRAKYQRRLKELQATAQKLLGNDEARVFYQKCFDDFDWDDGKPEGFLDYLERRLGRLLRNIDVHPLP